MSNQEVAQFLYQIAAMLEITGESKFRIVAYERAGHSVEHLARDIRDIWQQGKLEQIEGIGPSIAETIAELLGKGRSRYFEELRKKVPKEELELTEIPGVGPRSAKLLYSKYKIKGIRELTKAAKSGRIRQIPHFGETSERNILRGIELLKKSKIERERVSLAIAEPIARDLVDRLQTLEAVEKCDAVGSLRRMRETIGDVDIIVASEEPKKVVEAFARFPVFRRILARGLTKASAIHRHNVRVDLEVLPLRDYGSLLQHFTGSKEHNVRLRTWAVKKGLKVSEHGIVKKGKTYHFYDEPSFYRFLGLEYIPPEMREDTGEFDLALKHKLPKLVELKDMRGDLHVHTIASDGSNKPEELVREAKNLGYDYLCLSDHTKGLGIASGLDEKRFARQLDLIKKLNKKIRGFHLLSGAEVNITATGDLDIRQDVLSQMDIVIGSVHSSFNQTKEVMTKRIIKAINNREMDILGHPSGRLIGEREPYEVDWPAVFRAAAKNKVALEVNSSPERLDLKDVLIKEAIKYGVKIAIDTDSHNLDHLLQMRYGVAQARRGWARKGDVINTMSAADLMKWAKRKGGK